MQSFSFTTAFNSKILPAVTLENASDAVPVAEAFLEAGLNVMEIAFRTAAAADAVAAIRKSLPEMQTGAGTILLKSELQAAVDAGAQFCLSPGFNPFICKEAKAMNMPFIPGVMTPSEIELAVQDGFKVLKLFPAAQIGGPDFLKAMLGPYEQLGIHFIPMGGVKPGNMREYLAIKNVVAVGGSWLVTQELLSKKNYSVITKNVQDALAIANNL